MNNLVKKVFESIIPKQIQVSFMNGKIYIELIKII